MNRLLRTVALMSLLATAGPALAQYGDSLGAGHEASFERGLRQLEWYVDQRLRDGQLSARDGLFLRDQISRVRAMERYYARDGISRWEEEDLRTRLVSVRRQIEEGEGFDDWRDDGWTGDAWHDDGSEDWEDREWNWDDEDESGWAQPAYPGASWNQRDRSNEDFEDDNSESLETSVDPENDRNGDGWDDRDRNRDGVVDPDSFEDFYTDDLDEDDGSDFYPE